MLSRKQVMVAMVALGAFSILALAGDGFGFKCENKDCGFKLLTWGSWIAFAPWSFIQAGTSSSLYSGAWMYQGAWPVVHLPSLSNSATGSSVSKWTMASFSQPRCARVRR